MQTVRIEQRRAPARPRDRRSGAPGFGAEPHLLKDPPQRNDKPNSVPDSPPEAAHQATTIPLAPPSLAGSSNLPGGFGRAALWRLPIWSCSVRGLACHSPCGKRGALLPHLFTLTRRRPAGSGGASPEGPARRSLRSKRMRAICFLCHFPSGRPDRGLPGALPSGVRTFLPVPRHQVTGHAAVVCPSTADCQRAHRTMFDGPAAQLDNWSGYPSPSCLIWYCSSFLYKLLRGVSMTSAVLEMFQPCSRNFSTRNSRSTTSLNSRKVDA